LSGNDIALGARIVAVADAYDVMTSHRSYRRPQSPASAKAELARCGGEHFDPDIVRAFLRVSTGYLAWLLFPLAWLAQLALTFGGAPTAVARLIRSGTQTAAAVGAGTVAVVAGVAVGLAPVSNPTHPGSTKVATAPPAAASPAPAPPTPPTVDAPVAADVASTEAARRTRAASNPIGTDAVIDAGTTAAPTAPAAPRKGPPEKATSTHVIRLVACVDPVRVVIEAIPGISISPTRAC
jgi:hypothetical protein